MTRRPALLGAFAAVIAAAFPACAADDDETTTRIAPMPTADPNTSRAAAPRTDRRPPIDRAAPATFETATFALG